MPQTPNASLILSIAIGSAIGGVARYLLTSVVQERATTAFPFGTLAVNILGCLAIGLIVQLLTNRADVSPQIEALLTTGFCGGFTTFSTFSYESVRLMQVGAMPRAALYVGLSVTLGLSAYWFGMVVARGLRAA